jgi:hypothetical protein
MSHMGKVVNGAVVLPPEAKPAEGTEVKVKAARPLAERLKDLIGIIDDMPADWAEQHDHYIHGTPKK